MIWLFPWVPISFSFKGTNNFRFTDTAGLDASVKQINGAFQGCGMHTPYKLGH